MTKSHRQHRREEREALLRSSGRGKPIAVAWYTRDSWQHLAEVAGDGGTGHSSFEEWERHALAGLRQMAAAGGECIKIYIDVDALVAWCRAKGRKMDSMARAEFAGGAGGWPPPSS